MSEEKSNPGKDQYRNQLEIRNGWRCRICGAYPSAGSGAGGFVDGVCPWCRDRMEHIRE